jgi:hypothetical protein
MSYLTIKQAAEATRKSEKTIRRLCNSPKSKDYMVLEDGKILIDANYLQQTYPMSTPGQTAKKDTRHSLPMPTQKVQPIVQAPQTDSLQHEIDLLKLQLRYKDEILGIKDRQIETLERSLLLLGEGMKREPVPAATEPIAQAAPDPPKKKRWWQF